jgi:hypothetical protein
MKFPLILRSDHEEEIRLTNIIISSLQQKVVDQGLVIAKQEKEIEALIEHLNLATATPTLPAPKIPKVSELILTGRGGWRARATKRTRDSIPTPRDSGQALEEKVKKEGGKV